MPVTKEKAGEISCIHPQEIYATRMMILQEEFGFDYFSARFYLRYERNEYKETIIKKLRPDIDEKTKDELLLKIDEIMRPKYRKSIEIERALGRFRHLTSSLNEY